MRAATGGAAVDAAVDVAVDAAVDTRSSIIWTLGSILRNNGVGCTPMTIMRAMRGAKMVISRRDRS